MARKNATPATNTPMMKPMKISVEGLTIMENDDRLEAERDAFVSGFVAGWFGEGDLDKSMAAAWQEFLASDASDMPHPAHS